jgi:putative oxidoreductase
MLGELGLGLLLLVGLCTRVSGLVVTALMGMIFLNAYVLGPDEALTLRGSGTFHGIESLSYAVSGVVLFCTGPGALALDTALARRRSGAGVGVPG